MTEPLGRGSIALGLHLSPGDPVEGIRSLCAQATTAERFGFDGVTLSEHHGGFPGYLPVPTATAGRLLAVTERIWSAACPLLLPLRTPAAVVEELAWLSATYPGRVGAGVAIGYQLRDFETMGVDYERRRPSFNEALPWLVAALRGVVEGPLADDPAVRALAAAPVPVLSGVGGPKGAARAARAGAGLLLTSHTAPSAVRSLMAVYRQAGGSAPCVLIRRVWLGEVPHSVADQLAAYRNADRSGVLPDVGDTEVVHGDAGAVAEKLVEECADAGVDALNLRIFALGEESGELLSQIEQVGAEVLPVVRRRLSWGDRRSPA